MQNLNFFDWIKPDAHCPQLRTSEKYAQIWTSMNLTGIFLLITLKGSQNNIEIFLLQIILGVRAKGLTPSRVVSSIENRHIYSIIISSERVGTV